LHDSCNRTVVAPATPTKQDKDTRTSSTSGEQAGSKSQTPIWSEWLQKLAKILTQKADQYGGCNMLGREERFAAHPK
jgi:hypothetical protein